MKITANIATYPSREENLIATLKSLKGFDEVRVHINYRNKYLLSDEILHDLGVTKITTYNKDLADNGKFFSIGENEYAFTMDDDLIYPASYVKDMLNSVGEFGSIVTHHGRELSSPVKHYYKQTPVYHCLNHNNICKEVPIGGTGVMAWDTRYFLPNIPEHPLRMSDVLFAHQAAKQEKKITILTHKKGYIKHTDPKFTIHRTISKHPTPVHNRYCEEIIKMRDNKFKHFLLTRYNCGLYSENAYKISDKEGWMRQRIELFKATCVSVHAQSEKNFKWIIAIDPNTTRDDELEILKYSKAHIVREEIQGWVRKQKVEADWIITTRLDNDDLIDKDFIKEIQGYFEPKDHLIDTVGQQWDYRNYYHTGRKGVGSPFITLVEKWEHKTEYNANKKENEDYPRTALHRPHNYMPQDHSSRMIDKCLYTQVIHGGNLKNKITGKRK